jgi:hypothetical protein
MKRRALAAMACAWVLWAQTRTSAPGRPITDAWDIVDTFKTQEECERARLAIAPRREAPDPGRSFTTRYVCFPDTLDPQATP